MNHPCLLNMSAIQFYLDITYHSSFWVKYLVLLSEGEVEERKHRENHFNLWNMKPIQFTANNPVLLCRVVKGFQDYYEDVYSHRNVRTEAATFYCHPDAVLGELLQSQKKPWRWSSLINLIFAWRNGPRKIKWRVMPVSGRVRLPVPTVPY